MYLEESVSEIRDLLGKQGALIEQILECIQPQKDMTKPNGEVPTQAVDEAVGPTFDEVNAIAQRLARVKGQETAIGLIKQHGAAKLLQLDKKEYPSFIASAELLLNQSADL